MMTTMRIALLAWIAIFAELPPSVYEDLQRAAPEALSIQVMDVEVHRSIAKPSACSFLDFEVRRKAIVRARVIGVIRSKSGVRPGDVIAIDYTSVKPCHGVNGPRPIELLKEGDRVSAFLTKSGSVFVPAARGGTFSVLSARSRSGA
jgi:hypothetical protein